MNQYFKLCSLAFCAAVIFSGTHAMADKRSIDEAEQTRLRGEMQKLAQKNAWQGVERAFTQMQKLKKVDLCWQDYQLGGEAARNNADPDTYLTRTWQARAAAKRPPKNCTLKVSTQALSQLNSSIDSIQSKWARVKITGKKKVVVNFVKAPFNPDLSNSARAVFETLKNKGKYTGLLALGQYQISNGKTFQVKAAKWNDAEKCVKKWDKKNTFKHDRCLAKVKLQKIKIKVKSK